MYRKLKDNFVKSLVATEMWQGAAAQGVERMCGEIASEIEALKDQLQQHEREQGCIRVVDGEDRDPVRVGRGGGGTDWLTG